ncbi:MAG: glycosyltransferase family 2 protein [Candidatus Daviesbacteria bacterium]|nr:MAG: glycosyltransferase family 2 protein [Candidatus Daviesbacteria bacterium]
MNTKPLVSVIITTKNSAPTMDPLLKSVKEQNYKNIETVVVDNRSTDKTADIARKYTSLVFQKGPERSAQRNFGAQKSRGKYLLFLDSDMVLTNNVVKDCVETFERDNNKLGGLVVPERSFGQGLWAKAKILEREINRGEGFFESARFFPKKIFMSFKGYDENLTGPEDWDLPQRIRKTYTIGRIKSFINHNEGELSLSTLFRKKMYYGLSASKYLTKHKISIISPTTIYFLRPAFYKNWRMLLTDPVVSLGMLVMLSVEFIGGGIGYLKGSLKIE